MKTTKGIMDRLQNFVLLKSVWTLSKKILLFSFFIFTSFNIWTAPIHNAVYLGDYKVLEELIDSGVNINEVDSEGRTAMDIAKLHGPTPMVEILAKNGGLTAQEVFGEYRTDQMDIELNSNQISDLVTLDSIGEYEKALWTVLVHEAILNSAGDQTDLQVSWNRYFFGLMTLASGEKFKKLLWKALLQKASRKAKQDQNNLEINWNKYLIGLRLSDALEVQKVPLLNALYKVVQIDRMGGNFFGDSNELKRNGADENAKNSNRPINADSKETNLSSKKKTSSVQKNTKNQHNPVSNKKKTSSVRKNNKDQHNPENKNTSEGKSNPNRSLQIQKSKPYNNGKFSSDEDPEGDCKSPFTKK